jgi:histidine triad (HIT) family protein
MVECIICEKIREKKARIVYEDDSLIAIIPGKPAANGHIKIMPKKHATKIEELENETFQAMIFLSSFASSTIYETIKAQGTNIILNEGENHISIDIIPRKEGDGLNFLWNPKQINPDDFDNIISKIKDKAFTIGKTEKKIPVLEEKKQILRMSDEEFEQKTSSVQKIISDDNEQKNDSEKIPDNKDKQDKPKEKINYLLKNLEKIP